MNEWLKHVIMATGIVVVGPFAVNLLSGFLPGMLGTIGAYTLVVFLVTLLLKKM